MKPADIRLAGMLVLFYALPQFGYATPQLDAYALSAAGLSKCGTFGPDHRTAKFGVEYQVSLPDAGCAVAEDSREVTSSAGSVMADSSLAGSFGTSPYLRTFHGSSGGRAQFGDLGASASASFTGVNETAVVVGSQAGALQTDTMTFHGSSGAGVFLPTFTIDGSLFGVGLTESEILFSYEVDAGPQYLSFRIRNNRGDVSFYAPGGYVADFPGMTTSGDLATGLTVSGSTKFTLSIPIQFDTAADFTFAVWAAVIPGSNGGGDVSFLTTAKLTGIDVLGSDGLPLSDFSIDAASGTHYGRAGVIDGSTGVVGVPEPPGMALMLLGLAVCGGLSWQRARRQPEGVVP